MSRSTRVSQYQKGKTNLDFTKARDSKWQTHHLDDKIATRHQKLHLWDLPLIIYNSVTDFKRVESIMQNTAGDITLYREKHP